ncbi:MAG: adenosine kinase [Rhodospirillaceae bacterium]|jgi:sugar/nucleoside kinase (ribokinase family)|nr:adenosine kinase [Rhodospirillaceae bacterium]MBT6116456.1 adenosine kinase [Rhodospirillaceae bacterium]
MATASLDVVGIGNAIVDVLAHAEDGFLDAHGLAKGAMTLIDAEAAEALYAAMGPAVEISGGSAANTLAGLASLGGQGAFIGKVRNDQLGAVFAHDIRAAGTGFDTEFAADGPPTARCLVLVTPDAQRTMQTYLGAAVDLGPEDVEPGVIESAGVTYLEGYLWDPPRAKAAFLKAAEIAHGAGRRVALSLSDPFCVERHRAEFRDLVENHVDILFANEAEIVALYETADFDSSLEAVRGRCELVALTRSEKGSVVLKGDETHAVAAAPVDRVVDTTGAGDLYAAGFLYGAVRDFAPAECARLGGLAAAEAISHLGARPETPLAALIAAARPAG